MIIQGIKTQDIVVLQYLVAFLLAFVNSQLLLLITDIKKIQTDKRCQSL